MSNRLIIFEDFKAANFYPLSLSRPVYDLRCGTATLWDKIAQQFSGYEVAFSCRSEVAAVITAETGKKANQTDFNRGDKIVFVNGRVRLSSELTKELKSANGNRIFHQGDVIVAYVITEPMERIPHGSEPFEEVRPFFSNEKAEIIEGKFEFYEYIWDLVTQNGKEIERNYPEFGSGISFRRMIKEASIDSSVRILSENNFYISPGAEIGACAVIDNRRGPVIIDKDAVIGPLSYIEGPCYIGQESRIFRGNIREGCSFGPACRVGGEVEESIFQGYTNKYHDGFMGHAYLGSWVNLGALTTNSDLKNNYRNISVSLNGQKVDTGLQKIGSFIGDHSKTGIGTLLNTGVSIGFCCNIFGGVLVASPEVRSFSWGNDSRYETYQLQKAIEVARTAMSRRGKEFLPCDKQLFSHIYSAIAKQ